jgi:Leucine-rich repeat (LRR) protein
VEVHYLKSNKEFDYSELQKAAEKAVEGYTALNKDAFNEAGKQKLQEAIELWKKEVATTDIQNRKARINKRSAGRLYKNIGLAYAYLRDYKSARENIKSALKLYPSMSNNSTVYWEQLGERFYHQQKYYEMNKDAEVVLDQPKVNVENRGIAGYNDVRSGYQAFLGNEMSDQIATAKKEREEAIASGEENPYKTQMVHSATQGYMLMIPNLSSATLTSLADMKNAMKKLEEFPVEICELTQLNQLILKNNKIKTIPTDIGKLVNLTKLDLAKNQIASLPSELGELKKLKTLVLKGNPLTDGEVDKIQKLLPKCKIKI